MSKILPNSLFPSGTRVTITDRIRHKVLPPGSTCFILNNIGSVQRQYNLMLASIVITRKGKKGKERFETRTIFTTVFPEEFNKRTVINNRVDGVPVVELQPDPITKDVLDLSELDFLAWAFSKRQYLNTIYNTIESFKLWPTEDNNPMNVITSLTMLTFLSRKKSNVLKTALRDAKNTFANKNFRLSFINSLRKMEIIANGKILEENVNSARTRLAAIASLVLFETVTKFGLYDTNILKKNYNFYRDQMRMASDLSHKMKIKKWHAAKQVGLLPLEYPYNSLDFHRFILRIEKGITDVGITDVDITDVDMEINSTEPHPIKALTYPKPLRVFE